MRHAKRLSSPALKNAGVRVLATAALLLAATASAAAGSPRWVSGLPYFTNLRQSISWYTLQPQYFTDPGDLSPSVNHAAADALVAHAAAVWNIPTASLVLAQGGTLGEHISGANVYATASGLVFPSDVQTTNYAAKQIAVIYDSDGSVTDLLLGSGASDPSGCLQGGVTESVDSMTPQAQIQHAILILNGRCTGPEPEKQLQMQYQLMRAFGRILGLGWSQTNDNVFTGTPAPTNTQALNWPIMHPIDIVCGPYTYQCLPQPFTLRPDDISTLEQLYFIQQGQAAPGKVPSWNNAGGTYGRVTFPNGQGMEGVNVVVQRRAPFWDTAEDWQTASSVTGYSFRGQSPTSMAAPGTTPSASMGAPWLEWEGYWNIQSIPVPPTESWTDLIISTEPINPLYIGPYAIGPGSGNTMSPSGTPQVQVSQYLANGRDNLVNFTPLDAAPTCASQADEIEGAPMPVPQQGWWTGTLCGYQHQAWSSLQVKANRTLTLEITALDEQGLVSMTKAMPILGVWNSTDATGTLPTVAEAAIAFNSLSVGMTSLNVGSSTSKALRIALADQRGAGRPDFNYQARVFYADSVAPANVPANGAAVTITGMGFRQGNVVLVNGVAAAVTSWSPTSIIAIVPSLHSLGLSRATLASITVQDVSTGGSSTMSGVLTYAASVEALQLISAPTGTLPAGAVAATTFSVKAVAPDGFTPIVGEAVSFTATGAGAALNPCATSSCTVLTNAAGIASASVTPMAQGSIMLTAAGRSGTAVASFTATGSPDVLHLLSAPSGTQTVGLASTAPFALKLLEGDGITPVAGEAVVVTATGAPVSFSACGGSVCTLTTNAQGIVQSSVTATAAGAVTLMAAGSAGAVTAEFTAVAPPDVLHAVSAPSGTVYLGDAASAPFAVRITAADGVSPVVGKPITFSALAGTVTFEACNASVCVVPTDAAGVASTLVSPTYAGQVGLVATSEAGSMPASFTAAVRIRTIIAAKPVQYVAEGVAVAWSPQVTLADDSASSANVPVTWTGSAGFTFSPSTSSSDGAGVALGSATAGALVAGARAQGSACAWGSICASLAVQGVGAADWRFSVISGAAQSVSSGDTLGVVILQVVDTSGDPVAGVPVQIEQTVSAWEAACPSSGRCPLASTINSFRASAVSDINGLISIAPAQIGGVPSITRIAAIAGSAGFATLSLEKHP